MHIIEDPEQDNLRAAEGVLVAMFLSIMLFWAPVLLMVLR